MEQDASQSVKFGEGRATRRARSASLSGEAKSGGKVNEFAVYFHRHLFDTPENRVITSGLTFGLRLTQAFGSSNPSKTSFNLANIVNGLCDKPQGNRSGKLQQDL